MLVWVPSHTPSWKQGFARNAAESAAPGLWKGLVGLWVPSLGPTGLTLRDLCGAGNHGALTNMDPATDWVTTGQRGIPWALDFAGGATDETVDLGDPQSLEPSTWSGMTLFISARRAGTAAWDTLLDKGEEFQAAANTTLNFGIRNNDRMRFNVSNGVALTGIETGDTVIDAGVWRDYAATWDGTTSANGMKIYRDAVLIEQGTADYAISSVVHASGRRWWLSGHASGANQLFFTGLKSRVGIWSRDLLPSEIQQLHTDPMDLLRKRIQIFPAAVAAAVGNPWYHYANQAAIVG